MRILLKAMGFWIWGLIAIGLSVSVVTLSYRLGSNYRWQTAPAVSVPSPTMNFTATAEPALVPAPVDASPKGAMLSRVIGREMIAARQAMQDGRWHDALDNLDAAQAKSPLTPFDVKTIHEFKAYAYVKINNLKAAQTSYEAELATGLPTADEAVKVFRTLFHIASSTGQHSKAIEYGKQLADSGAIGTQELVFMTQAFYLSKNCKETSRWADKAVAALREAGEPPKVSLYLFKLQCASDAGDNLGMSAALFDLIRLTNEPRHWNMLLRIERQNERDDHNLLMIYRLMYDTQSMTAGTDYIEMAQLLGDVGLPGEALTVLQNAESSGPVTDIQKERTTRLTESMRIRADADRRSLQNGSNVSDGLAAVRGENLSELYFGFGEYPAAVDSISLAVDRHAVKRLDDAYVYLGRADVALKDTDAARSAFAQLKTVPGVSPRMLSLWSLYAETLDHPMRQTAAE